MDRRFIAIDLKSFYASVEAAEQGYDPLDVNLVVADESRTDKTICLAVSPALKALGIPGRPRLFEVRQRLEEANRERRRKLPGHEFGGKSVLASELAADPALEIAAVIARPRMKYYMDYSRKIVEIYLRYVSPDDLLVYSIDEVFIDASRYLESHGLTAREFAMTMIREVLRETGITATAGIGTNMYLAKVAMDIVAKHIPADENGVRIAELDERSYREQLWCHRPLTDFWRVGRGIARKLEANGIFTMGDVARCSEGPDDSPFNEDLLYRLFGVNAAHRPRLGLGANRDRGLPRLPAGIQKLHPGPGAAAPVYCRRRPHRRAGDGRPALHGACPQGLRHRPGGPGRGL